MKKDSAGNGTLLPRAHTVKPKNRPAAAEREAAPATEPTPAPRATAGVRKHLPPKLWRAIDEMEEHVCRSRGLQALLACYLREIGRGGYPAGSPKDVFNIVLLLEQTDEEMQRVCDAIFTAQDADEADGFWRQS